MRGHVLPGNYGPKFNNYKDLTQIVLISRISDLLFILRPIFVT